MTMRVERTWHRDRIPDNPIVPIVEQYDYEVIRFMDGDTVLVARLYSSDQDEASFLSAESGGERRLLTRADLETKVFREAVEYLRTLGVKRVQWLNPDGEGYEAVPVPQDAGDAEL